MQDVWFRPTRQMVTVEPLALRTLWLDQQEPDVGVMATKTQRACELWMSYQRGAGTVRGKERALLKPLLLSLM